MRHQIGRHELQGEIACREDDSLNPLKLLALVLHFYEPAINVARSRIRPERMLTFSSVPWCKRAVKITKPDFAHKVDESFLYDLLKRVVISLVLGIWELKMIRIVAQLWTLKC